MAFTCSHSTIETPEQWVKSEKYVSLTLLCVIDVIVCNCHQKNVCHSCRSEAFIVNFKQISHIVHCWLWTRKCLLSSWLIQSNLQHCVKSVRIRSYSGPHFPAFGLNTERYGVSLRIQSECGKMRTRITPNTDTFYAVQVNKEVLFTVCCEHCHYSRPCFIYLGSFNRQRQL